MNKTNNKKKSNNIEHYAYARPSSRGVGRRNYKKRDWKLGTVDIMMLVCSMIVICGCVSLIPIAGLIMYLNGEFDTPSVQPP